MLTRAENLIWVSEICRGDDDHWFRYLSKEFDGDRCKLTNSDVEQIISSGKLDPRQEEMLREACTPGSDMARRLIAFRAPAKTPMVDSLLASVKVNISKLSEDEIDIKAYKEAMAELEEDPTTYSMDEVKKILEL